MLDIHRLREQFDDFNVYQSREQALARAKLARALEALEACGAVWEELRDRARAEDPGWLVAELREYPGAVYGCGDRPTPITVVAADGSQVYPDRHVEPSCYLLNISRIAFQYGTLERPLMEAVPAFKYRKDDLEEVFGDVLDAATAEIVSAVRDEYELQALLETARGARIDGRPIVALADGTLIRWMVRRLQNRAVEDRLIARYTALLGQFRDEGIPLCSYISMPRNTEVVNLLRLHLDEHRTPPPAEESLDGLVDRWVFEKTLAPGARSAVFESASHIQKDYGAGDRIYYFYVHIPAAGGGEIGRVEVPAWVAKDEEILDLVHAVVLSECEKGDGYPMVLSEAHERAVIRAHEKAVFYELIEREMTAAGLRHTGSRKQASKQIPRI